MYIRKQKYERTYKPYVKAGSRKFSFAPVTVGMQIKRASTRVSEKGVYDSKIVSATEVIFSSVDSTNGSYTGGSQDYEMLVNPLHPALKLLSDEAKNFQMFRFKKCKVIFESTCNSVTNGSIIIGQLTDVLEFAPNDYESAALLKDTIQSNVWQMCQLSLSLDDQFRYVSYSNDVTNSEVRQVNQAKIFYGLINVPIGQICGNIKLEYTCELSKRINGDPIDQLNLYTPSVINPSPTILKDPILQSIVNVRRTPWFERDDATLLLKPRASYIMNITLQLIADQSATTAGENILPYGPDGSSISLINDQLIEGYSDNTYTNRNVFTRICSFTTTETNSYISFNELVLLPGQFTLWFSINVVN